MAYRLRDIIDSLDYYELKKIEKDLTEGGQHLRRFVQEQVKKREHKHETICVNCHSEINQQSASTYTLVFGPSDFLKKASFCGTDCLEFFLERLKQKF